MHRPLDRQTLTPLFPTEGHRVDELLGDIDADHVSTDGDPPVVSVHGRALHSRRDPHREARRWARDVDTAESTVIVVLGYGSGYHVRAIAERSNARIIVFEPHLEVLAQGLQHGEIPDKTWFVTTPEKLGNILQGVLRGRDRGAVVQWPASIRLQPPLYADALERAREAVGRARLHHQTSTLRSPAWLDYYLTNLPNVTKGPSFPAMENSMQGIAAFIVAAGPSLDRNVRLLKEVGDKALIIAVNTASQALARVGIKPHALVTIESADITGPLGSLPWLEELPAFIELTANPAAWALPFAKRVPISVDTSPVLHFSRRLDPQLGMSAGFCVANAAVVIAERLGCNPITLVGSDLAYAGERVYASGTVYENMRAKSRGDGVVDLEGLEARRDIERRSKEALGHNSAPVIAHTVTVPAWSGTGEVTTTGDFKMMRDWYTHHVRQVAGNGVSYINATEGGSYIEDWEHIPLRDVIERHQLGGVADSAPVARRFAKALARDSFEPHQVARELQGELERVHGIIELSQQASDVVGHDPDGDLTIDEDQAAKLSEINAKSRALIAESALAQAAIHVPVERICQRGNVTTHGFYASLIEPLQELAEKLARLLQTLEAQPRSVRRTG